MARSGLFISSTKQSPETSTPLCPLRRDHSLPFVFVGLTFIMTTLLKRASCVRVRSISSRIALASSRRSFAWRPSRSYESLPRCEWSVLCHSANPTGDWRFLWKSGRRLVQECTNVAKSPGKTWRKIGKVLPIFAGRSCSVNPHAIVVMLRAEPKKLQRHSHPAGKIREGRPAGSRARRKEWTGMFRPSGRLGLPTSTPGGETRHTPPRTGSA